MIFLPKYDRSFKHFMMTVILFCAACFFLPFLISSFDIMLLWIMIGLYIVVVGVFLWTMLTIRYTFRATYLQVTGGPFHIKIPYKQMTHITRTADMRSGLHLMTSKDGLAIYYQSARRSEFKISPAKQQAFLEELLKRAPQIQLYIT
ncbi:PH domain-containing protein [Lysinibacillus sp. KU-BSD001]|uniref:PH domain-containing protein n=1 Tax=Lysinibacillus sp. KU-BSD001 TaxID=3141328 RepID=UPI0036E785FC